MSAKKTLTRIAQCEPRKSVVTGATVLETGVLLGGLGVCLAVQSASFNPFGPIKALTVALGVTLVFLGFALDPARVVRGLARLGRVRASLAVPAFLLVGVLATATSLDAEQSIVGHYPEYQGLLLVLAAASLGLGAAVLADEAGPWGRFKRFAALATAVVSAIAVIQVFGAGGRIDLSRAASTTGNASNLGVFLCLTLPFVLAAARSERSALWRVMAWVGLAIGMLGLVLTLSRGAWLGAGAAIIAWLLLEGRGWSSRVRVRAWVAIGVVVAILLVAVLSLVPHAGSRVMEALRSPSKGTLGWRAETWRITAGLVAERPLLGFGPAFFATPSPQ